MGLRIDPSALATVHEHVEEGFPHEVVGILAGSRESWQVQEAVPLVNERADSPRNRYRVSGLVMMRAEQAVEAKGLEVVGYYHSHPDHPARYSDYDRDHALPNMSYVIVSVTSTGVADTLSWRLTEDRTSMDAENIEVTAGSADQVSGLARRPE